MGEDKETQKAVKAAMASHAKLVIGDDQKRQEMCMREIQEALNKYDCALVPTAMVKPGAIEFMIETLAKPKDGKQQPAPTGRFQPAPKAKKDALQKGKAKGKAPKKKVKKG